MLVVDDEKNITIVVEAILAKDGFEVVVFNDSRQAIQALDPAKNERWDTVVTDLYMPGISGMDILRYCQTHRAHVPVVVITAYGTVESAVAALKSGAFDYISKPFEQKDLLDTVRKAVRTHNLEEKEWLPTLDSAEKEFMIGKSPEIGEIQRVIEKVARSQSTVLILGESGTGKELVAYEIHSRSDRASKAFIKVNCAAIPSTLIESELFGYEKGAFTGATAAKPGRFELAHQGTLFLDEVAEMSQEMQVKLLRAIQEQEFERVGGVKPVKVDVRIVAATNRDLHAEVEAGRFREDLFYRLNVVPIHVPALRDRKGDIELLIQTFITQFNEKLSKRIAGTTPACLQALKLHAWPGNVRQLENVIERMMILADGPLLDVRDLPQEFGATEQEAEGDKSFKEIVKEATQSVERDLIEKALLETEGNVTHAAEKLGLSRKGLQIKMKELGIRSK